MQINRGEIWYVEPTWKNRGDEMVGNHPAVIVSSAENNLEGRTYEVVFLTTKAQDPARVTDVEIHSSGRLATALCHQITTVSVERIQSYLGKCTEDEMERINAALMTSLSLSIFEAPKKNKTNLQRVRRFLDAYNETSGEEKANYAAQLAGVLDFVLAMEEE